MALEHNKPLHVFNSFALRRHRADDNQLDCDSDGGDRGPQLQPSSHDRAHDVKADGGLLQQRNLRHACAHVTCAHPRVGTSAFVVGHLCEVGTAEYQSLV